uniref:SMP-LTD domain-containing protein n=1 Tax=Plectus sambesii TaxID=2011161 RepID=A0A914ULS8_9BILA
MGSFDHEQCSASTPFIVCEKGAQWPSYDGNGSVSSTDGEHSKFGNFFRKAKARGKRFVHRRKNKPKLVMEDQKFQTDRSPIEAVEESASSPDNSFIALNDIDIETPSPTVPQSQLQQSTTTSSQLPGDQPSEVVHEGAQASCQPVEAPVRRKISFLKFRFAFGLLLLVMTFLLPPLLVSFLWGAYIAVMVFLYLFVLKAIVHSRNEPTAETLQSIAKEIDRQKVLKEVIHYRGWMNELRRPYDPLTYSVGMTKSVMVELEGRTLRIARPKQNVIRLTFFNDPILREPDPIMIKCYAYDLTNADVTLRPHGLARRRWWNRKFPILIQLAPQKGVVAIDGDNDDSDSDFSQSDSENLNDNPISEESEFRRRLTISKSIHNASIPKANEEGNAHLGSTKSGARGKRIILFARSSREKERWFHRLREACSVNRTTTGVAFDVDQKRASNLSVPSIFDQYTISGAAGVNSSIEHYLYISYGMEFAKTMAEVMNSSSVEHLPENGIIRMDLDLCQWTPKAADFNSKVILAANAVVARLFFDFCRDERWVHAVSEKIDKKLATIDLPHFIEKLTLSQLKLGTTVPHVIGIHSPVMNDWGLWVDVEVKYNGGLELIIETKVDLVTMMEKKDVVRKVTPSKLASETWRHYSVDELSSSFEDSANEDFGGNTAGDESSSGMGKKVLTVIGRVIKSRFFHNVAELGPIKKIMEEISSTRLMLNVEVTLLEGTLAINIPPPPSDRLWFGFRRPPKLLLKAVPQVGDRTVDMSTVSAWIENRLHVLLEKYLVVPNMADVVCPFMTGNELFKFGYTN